MPKRSVNSDSTGTGLKERTSKMTIAAVAASTVDGYLRNASRRMRVPAGEGGRGTRRKLDMVTSAEVHGNDFTLSTNSESKINSENSVVDDEWDVVELGITHGAHEMAKREHVTKVEETNINNDDINCEGSSKLFTHSAEEETEMSNSTLLEPKREHSNDELSVEPSTVLPHRTTMNRVKRERDNDTDEGVCHDDNDRKSLYELQQSMRRTERNELQHETSRTHLSVCEKSATTNESNEQENATRNSEENHDERHTDKNDKNNDDDDDDDDDDDEVVMMEGARPPLTEERSRHAEFGRTTSQDPTYAAMHEQQDVLAARRRSERVQRTSEAITRLLLVLIRGRLL